MPATVPTQDDPVKLAAPFVAGPATSGTFGSAYVGGAGLGQHPAPPSSSERAPGDYLARFALKEVSQNRELLYTVAQGEKAVVREIVLANSSGAPRTVSLWIGGRLVEPGVSLAAGEAKRDAPNWIAYPGDTLEAQASGAGVACLMAGVEEVG